MRKQTARSWQRVAGGVAGGVVIAAAAMLGFAAGSAAAEPVIPPPQPIPIPTQAAPGVALAPVPAQPAPQPVPANFGTLRDYFAAKGVRLETQRPEGFTALDITVPLPAGWARVPDPNVPDAFVVIANRTDPAMYTPNAQLVVYKLVGDFDPHEAITHGYVDSQGLLAWRTTNASLADYGGFPSSIIEGTYRQNDMTLNTSRRHVIATSGVDRYLVTLSVTTAAGRAIGAAPATDAVVNGFRVAAPGTPAGPAPGPLAPAPPLTAPTRPDIQIRP